MRGQPLNERCVRFSRTPLYITYSRKSCSSVSSHAGPSGQCFTTEAYPFACPRLNQRFRNDAGLHFTRSYGLRVTSLLCPRSDCSWHTVHFGYPYRTVPLLGHQELSTGHPHGLRCACLTLHVMNRMSRCRGRQDCLTWPRSGFETVIR